MSWHELFENENVIKSRLDGDSIRFVLADLLTSKRFGEGRLPVCLISGTAYRPHIDEADVQNDTKATLKIALHPIPTSQRIDVSNSVELLARTIAQTRRIRYSVIERYAPIIDPDGVPGAVKHDVAESDVPQLAKMLLHDIDVETSELVGIGLDNDAKIAAAFTDPRQFNRVRLLWRRGYTAILTSAESRALRLEALRIPFNEVRYANYCITQLAVAELSEKFAQLELPPQVALPTDVEGVATTANAPFHGLRQLLIKLFGR